jgi:adenine deaminase
VRDTVRLAGVDRGTFALPAPAAGASGPGLVRVIRAIPDQLLTGEDHVEPLVEDGLVLADPARDLAKIAVLERHHATGRAGVGLVTGFGLRSGAFAGTVSHDAHNVIAVGVDDGDLVRCVERLRELGGGLVVCDGGEVVAEMPLPIAGLLSDRPAPAVHEEQQRLDAALAARGVAFPSPFMGLSFLGLSVIPALKITDRGLVDAATLTPVPFGVG